jgi:hypothetical protein
MRGGYRIAQGQHKPGSLNHPKKNVGAKADSALRQPRRPRQRREPKSRAPPRLAYPGRSPRLVCGAQSRKELGTSAGVGDFQAVRIGAGRPAHPCVATHVRDTPDLSAALRLCARQTTLQPPAPARRDDRRQTRTGRAEPQSRRALTSSAGVGDFQTVGIGEGRPAPRRGDRRRHPRPLGALAAWRDLTPAAPRGDAQPPPGAKIQSATAPRIAAGRDVVRGETPAPSPRAQPQSPPRPTAQRLRDHHSRASGVLTKTVVPSGEMDCTSRPSSGASPG